MLHNFQLSEMFTYIQGKNIAKNVTFITIYISQSNIPSTTFNNTYSLNEHKYLNSTYLSHAKITK